MFGICTKGGSLRNVLESCRSSGQRLPWTENWKMLDHICRGLVSIHSQEPPILHADLKSENILVRGNQSKSLNVHAFELSCVQVMGPIGFASSVTSAFQRYGLRKRLNLVNLLGAKARSITDSKSRETSGRNGGTVYYMSPERLRCMLQSFSNGLSLSLIALYAV